MVLKFYTYKVRTSNAKKINLKFEVAVK